ncbi:MAG: hypothetical protein HY822_10780 [Acidobacteria bacterium]|nr:hypothetical protein [Acidobacteriota bacterium]
MLIAMPNNQVLHRGDPRHTEKTFELFEAKLVRHIVPLVEKNYSVRPGRHGAGAADAVSDPKAGYLFVGLGTHENTPDNRSVLFHQELEKRGIKPTTTSAAKAVTTGAPGATICVTCSRSCFAERRSAARRFRPSRPERYANPVQIFRNRAPTSASKLPCTTKRGQSINWCIFM